MALNLAEKVASFQLPGMLCAADTKRDSALPAVSDHPEGILRC